MSSFEMKKFIKEVCNEIGPRLGTTEQEQKAGHKIKKIMEKVVDEAIEEEFSCHPGAFLGFTKVAFIAACVAAGLFFWVPLASMLLALYAVTTFLFEFLMLKEYVDFLFPKRKAANIVGKLRATKSPKQIVIISGHHDSAYEFPLFVKFKHNFSKLAYGVVGLLLLTVVVSLVKFILDVNLIVILGINIALFCVPVIGLGLGGYVAFKLHSNKVILGANDNLSGVAVALGVAHHFAGQRLQNIELWCISFACEENMRGSKRYVARHLPELQNTITINYDMVGRGIISIISAEPAYTTVHSMELAQAFQDASHAAGVTLPIKALGFGGTDAALFSKRGFRAISILGLTPQDYPDTWHELSDTPENLQEGRMEQTLQATILYLLALDAKLEATEK